MYARPQRHDISGAPFILVNVMFVTASQDYSYFG